MQQVVAESKQVNSPTIKINDFVVKFANVNGSGSASANHMFAKAVFRMGIPVSPCNIFPSNIQGLPTWYEVRINDKGYLSRRSGIDLMVAMNAQTIRDDIASVLPGGYVLYDSSKLLPDDLLREDVNYIGIPLKDICLREYDKPSQRQLFKNIVYIGALSALLNIEFKILKDMVSDQFKGKQKLIPPNIHALELGHKFASENYQCPLNLRLKKSKQVGNQMLIDGNTAIGLGCVYGGATVAAWYPLTPSTSVVDSFDKYCKRLRIDPGSGKKKFAIIQAEDELAAIGITIGAGWNGARAFTASSGPGISLMAEFLGLAYFSEVPIVVFNIQRVGPSTGMPTRTQQGDILACAYASHGDTKHILLFPSNPKECFDFAASSFEIAEQLQTPVIVMSDLELGMNDHLSDPFVWDDNSVYNRGKVLDAKGLMEIEKYGRYLDVDGDGIPYRTYPGTHPTKGAYFTRGSSHNEYAAYTEDGDVYKELMDRLARKFITAVEYLPAPEIKESRKKSMLGMIFFGSTTGAIQEALDELAVQSIKIDTLRIAAFPFHQSVSDFINSRDQVFVIEQNRDGQMKSLIKNESSVSSEILESILCYNGLQITAKHISQHIIENLRDDDKVAVA